MQLFLIRHAQSQNNALPEEQRVEDPGLTDLGHEQARHLADWIPSLALTRLITSPFLRALLTAEPISRTTSLTPEIRVELHEQGGCYRGHLPGNIVGAPGMTRAQIEQQFPGFTFASDIDGQGWWGSKPYETWHEANHRAALLLQRTCEEFGATNERVAFVTHADFKRIFLEQFHVDPLDTPCNTSVTMIEVTGTVVRLRDFNRVEHLTPELVTR